MVDRWGIEWPQRLGLVGLDPYYVAGNGVGVHLNVIVWVQPALLVPGWFQGWYEHRLTASRRMTREEVTVLVESGHGMLAHFAFPEELAADWLVLADPADRRTLKAKTRQE